MTGSIKTLPHIGEYTKPGGSRGISLSDGDCSTEEDENITEIRRNQTHRREGRINDKKENQDHTRRMRGRQFTVQDEQDGERTMYETHG